MYTVLPVIPLSDEVVAPKNFIIFSYRFCQVIDCLSLFQFCLFVYDHYLLETSSVDY